MWAGKKGGEEGREKGRGEREGKQLANSVSLSVSAGVEFLSLLKRVFHAFCSCVFLVAFLLLLIFFVFLGHYKCGAMQELICELRVLLDLFARELLIAYKIRLILYLEIYSRFRV